MQSIVHQLRREKYLKFSIWIKFMGVIVKILLKKGQNQALYLEQQVTCQTMTLYKTSTFWNLFQLTTMPKTLIWVTSSSILMSKIKIRPLVLGSFGIWHEIHLISCTQCGFHEIWQISWSWNLVDFKFHEIWWISWWNLVDFMSDLEKCKFQNVKFLKHL